MNVELGIDNFAAVGINPATGAAISNSERLGNLVEEIERADQVGVDVFGIGEHHRAEFLDSAPALILAAAAARTQSIRLTSAVKVLSADDPVRVFQEFATLDLISKGRAEIVVGRGSSIEAFPLFGYDLRDYDALFSEKLDLLLKLRRDTEVHWSGQFRAPLTGQGVYPRPQQSELPVWVGVGGTPASFARAGTLGLPLMVAIIGGTFGRFRPLVELYREAGRRAGHAPEALKVGVHAFGYVAPDAEQARADIWPGYLHMMGKLGRERGWSPPTRAQFDASTEPEGPFLVGEPAAVAQKVKHIHEALGGVSRVTLQMTNALLPHHKMLSAIDLLGQEVKPLLRALA